MNFNELLEIAKKRPSQRSFYELRKMRQFWGRSCMETCKNINGFIAMIENNNTAHGYVSTAKWALQIFYKSKFDPKMINDRPGEISKFTTRLQSEEVFLIRKQFKSWINEKIEGLVPNKVKYIKHSRMRIYHCFEALLCSGMRIGELISINFRVNPANRIIWSNINHQYLAEIIINTEKTCKKREIYIPNDTYNFFVEDRRKYQWERLLLTKSLVTNGFTQFAKWAKLPFKFSAHVLRRTKASFMHEANVDINTIAMVLGNTPKVVMNHYILSSKTNFDACELGTAIADMKVEKISNIYLTKHYRVIKKKNTSSPRKYFVTQRVI